MNPLEFLNKIKWDPDKYLEDYFLVLLHRGAPDDRKKISCKGVDIGKTFISTGRTRIPAHRILEIREGPKVVWKRKDEKK